METAKDILLRLQKPGCPVSVAAPTQTIVLSKVSDDSGKTCSTGTDAVIIDSNSLNDEGCAEIEWNIKLGEGVPDTQLMLGIFGQTGQYVNDLPAGGATKNTTDFAAATDDSGANTPQVGYFNRLLVSIPMLVTGFEIAVNNPATVPSQLNQSLHFVTRTFSAYDKCDKTKLAPLCNECQDQDIKSFSFEKVLDALHDLTYQLKAGADVTIRLRYKAIATGHAFVACED